MGMRKVALKGTAKERGFKPRNEPSKFDLLKNNSTLKRAANKSPTSTTFRNLTVSPEFRRALNNPEFRRALNFSSFRKMIVSPEFKKLLSTPAGRKLLASGELAPIRSFVRSQKKTAKRK
jgi:hypothetical protein